MFTAVVIGCTSGYGQASADADLKTETGSPEAGRRSRSGSADLLTDLETADADPGKPSNGLNFRKLLLAEVKNIATDSKQCMLYTQLTQGKQYE